MIESNTVLVCPIMLENSKNEKLLTKLQSLFKDENEKLTLRVSLTGTDAGTGDSLTFVNYYSQKDILFSHKYQLVESWTDDNILSLKWGNFNKTSINEDDKLEDFLNIKVS